LIGQGNYHNEQLHTYTFKNNNRSGYRELSQNKEFGENNVI